MYALLQLQVHVCRVSVLGAAALRVKLKPNEMIERMVEKNPLLIVYIFARRCSIKT